MMEETRKILDVALNLPPSERMKLARELMSSAAAADPSFAGHVGEAVSTYDPFRNEPGAPPPLAFTLEYWKDQDWYVGRLREIPGVFSQGESLAILEDNIRNAYELMAESDGPPAGTETRRKRIEVA